LTDLNNLLLELENNPDDVETMTSIFRIAHTLKGNSAAMGYESLSSIAHAVEDLLDSLRQGKKKMNNEIMNLIFEGVDMIGLLLEEVIESGQTGSNPEELISKIRSNLEEEKEVENEGGFTVQVKVNPDSQMKGIDAMLILKKIENIAEILSSSPSGEEISDGKFRDWFELNLKGSLEKISDLLGNLPQVNDFRFGKKKDPPSEQIEEAVSLTEADDEKVIEDNSAGYEKTRLGDKFRSENIQSIRISIHKLDELMNLVEELVVRKLKLENTLPQEVKKGIGSEFSTFDRIISRLQDTVMDLRLIPLKHVVDRLPRVVRDLSKSLGKEVNFVIEGKDVTVDRTVLDKIQDPLIHMIRNAIDHGIEMPDEREKAGKSRTGNLTLKAMKLKDHVVIEVSDDGKGLDVDKIKEKAIERNLITEERAEELSDEEIYNLILMPGFSTADTVTDVSGRGVGTDIIVNTVKSLGGSVEVKSEKGNGTAFRLRLPLSMAISQILLIRVGTEKYGIPLKEIIEVKPRSKCEIRRAGGVDRLVFRDSIIPVIHLNRVLEIDSNVDGKMLVIVTSLDDRVALACDYVLEQKEVVVKSLGMLKSVKGISGISILGEGEVIPILDINTLQEVNK
jgi:two-component system chemotaxis sensor kinase CheA